MAHQAQDTFVAQLRDGSSLRVAKGEVFADSHEVVKLDQAGSGHLFKPLDFGEEEKPLPKSGPAKAEPAKAEVKAEPKAAPARAARPAAGKASG